MIRRLVPRRPAIGLAVVAAAQLATLLLGCGDTTTTPNPPPGSPSAPADFTASGDPNNSNNVSLSWDSSANATSYNLYWRTTAGVTPANGTKIVVGQPTNAGAGRLLYRDTGRAAGTLYYIVTAVGAAGESAPSSEASITLADGISVAINHPQPGASVSAQVFFEIYVQSVFQIATVTAAIAGHQIDLTFSNIMPGPGAAWRGTLDITGVAAGDQPATVTVRDVKGNQAQQSVLLHVGVTPVITIQAPLQYTVARPTLHVTASCQDGSGPCQAFEVRVAAGPVPVTTLRSSTSGTLDADVDLSLVAGYQATVQFAGLSHSGVGVTANRIVYVEPSSVLHEYASVLGLVIDVAPGRILWSDSSSASISVKIRDVAAGTDVTALTQPNITIVGGTLTSTGAVFETRSSTDIETLYAFRNGALTTLDGASAIFFTAAGDFAIWNDGSTLNRYDAGTGATVTAANNAGNTTNGVAANGDVVYWTTGYQIVRVRGGTSTPITTGSPMSAYPTTDGTNIVYRQFTTFTGPWQITLFGGTGEVVLTTTPPDSPSPGSGYQANGGWAAYLQLASGAQSQVWVRSPAGDQRQASFFSGSSTIDALGPSGDVIFDTRSVTSSPSRRYLISSPYTANPTDIGSSEFGRAVYRGTTPYVLIGRSAFTVGP